MLTLDLARSVAAATSLDERERRLAAVPVQFQALVIKTASLMLAGQIAALRSRDDRRGALENVPARTVDLVRMHLQREFLARAELRRRGARPVNHTPQDDLFVDRVAA